MFMCVSGIKRSAWYYIALHDKWLCEDQTLLCGELGLARIGFCDVSWGRDRDSAGSPPKICSNA
jgi:hypothetical protein